MSLEQSLMHLTLAGTNAPSTSALSFLPHPVTHKMRSPAAAPTYSPSNPQCHSPGVANHRTTSPARSRSPSQPRRKARPGPIPVPSPTSGAAYAYAANPHISMSMSMSMSMSPPPLSAGVPASPERERRSRHRDDRPREHRDRDRSRERRERERAERLARYRSLSEASERIAGFGADDAGCLGGF